jgi:hypothetical protein
VRAMAAHAGVPVTRFVRLAVHRHLVAEHRRLWPELPTTPWDRFLGPAVVVPLRRVTSGADEAAPGAVDVQNLPALDQGGDASVPRAAESDAGGAVW